MAKKIIIIILLLLATLALMNMPEQSTITINGKAISLEIADSGSEQGRGLGGRQSLAPDRGMLFIYDRPSYYRFWMKDMKFPIDIVWLDDNFIIADIAQDVGPATFPNDFGPRSPARYVLEVNAGTAQNYGWHVGMRANFKR